MSEAIERAQKAYENAFLEGADAKEAMREAIRTLREPSETMQRAGFLANVHRLPDGTRVTLPADRAWQAIVDEILK